MQMYKKENKVTSGVEYLSTCHPHIFFGEVSVPMFDLLELFFKLGCCDCDLGGLSPS